MVELGYRYCELDKIHYYSVVSVPEVFEIFSTCWNQWLWHYIEFERTGKAYLLPYHAGETKILARYKGDTASVVAGHITRKIKKHRKRLKNV